MELVRAGGSFAVEVRDVALWRHIVDGDRDDICDAFQRHGVVIFRRQALSEEDLLNFGKLVGEPGIYAETHWLSSIPEVIILSNMRNQEGKLLGGLANKPLTWHTDQSYYEEPVTGCFLYGVELPLEGGATRWASLYNAYETLPLELLRVVNDAVGTFSYKARAEKDGVQNDNHDRKRRIRETPDVKHPLVNVNPATGRKALYIDPGTLVGIDGMPHDEVLDILKRLLQHVVRPENVYEHTWCPGDLVLWDNAAVLHARDGFPNEQNRLVKRMIVKLDPRNYIIPPILH